MMRCDVMCSLTQVVDILFRKINLSLASNPPPLSIYIHVNVQCMIVQHVTCTVEPPIKDTPYTIQITSIKMTNFLTHNNQFPILSVYTQPLST